MTGDLLRRAAEVPLGLNVVVPVVHDTLRDRRRHRPTEPEHGDGVVERGEDDSFRGGGAFEVILVDTCEKVGRPARERRIIHDFYFRMNPDC